jgi:prephenate dehydrogenase
MNKPTITIIGWTSKFWRFWERYFTERGSRVILVTRSTEITPREAIEKGDIIIFSVSIRHTVAAIREYIPYIKPNKLVMDFTGIKTEATQALSDYTTWEVVATHPMFWPWITTLQWQNIAYDPINSGKHWKYISQLWKDDGVNLIELSSKKHDELVAIVQSTVHIMNIMFGHILESRWINIDELMRISTPNSRMQICILARFLNQEASLYTDMQMENTVYKKEILENLWSYFSKMSTIIQDKKNEDLEKEFNIIKEYIGKDFLDKALKTSSEFDEHIKQSLTF